MLVTSSSSHWNVLLMYLDIIPLTISGKKEIYNPLCYYSDFDFTTGVYPCELSRGGIFTLSWRFQAGMFQYACEWPLAFLWSAVPNLALSCNSTSFLRQVPMDDRGCIKLFGIVRDANRIGEPYVKFLLLEFSYV